MHPNSFLHLCSQRQDGPPSDSDEEDEKSEPAETEESEESSESPGTAQPSNGLEPGYDGYFEKQREAKCAIHVGFLVVLV